MEPLTPAEDTLLAALRRGQQADFRTHDDDVAKWPTWGPERTLRARVIVALCTDPASAGLTARRVRIAGARIDGWLGFAATKLSHSLQFLHCGFEHRPDFEGAETSGLDFEGC